MNALQMSAQFAAYVWYKNQDTNRTCSQEEAWGFARRNWERFLPHADAGFGRLLLRLASERKKRRSHKSQPDIAMAG